MVKQGDRFSKLVVVSHIARQNSHKTWRCACDCGRLCVAREDKLLTGRTKSCGCMHAEMMLASENRKNQADQLKNTLRELKKSLALANRLNTTLLARKAVKIGIPAEDGARQPDFRKFAYKGSPRQVCQLLRDWTHLVSEVLPFGPEDDVVEITVNIAIDRTNVAADQDHDFPPYEE